MDDIPLLQDAVHAIEQEGEGEYGVTLNKEIMKKQNIPATSDYVIVRKETYENMQ